MKDCFVLSWSLYICYTLTSDYFKLKKSMNRPRTASGSCQTGNRSASQDVTFRVYYINGIKPKIRIIDENEQSYSYHSEYSSSLAPPSPKVSSGPPIVGPTGADPSSSQTGYSLNVSHAAGRSLDLPQMISNSNSKKL